MLNSRWIACVCVCLLAVWALACKSPTLPLAASPQPTGQQTRLPSLPPAAMVQPTDRPTLTPTSTPTPTPTPTPLPAVRLARAERAVFNGDYDAAALDYAAILAGATSTAEARAALFGAATVKLRAGDAAAVDALRALVTRFPGDAREAEAWFLLGEARLSNRDYSGAVQAYRQYQKLRGDLIAAYVNQRVGDALRADKKPLDAVEAFRAALSAPSAIALDLREKLAGAHLDANDLPSAVAQYDAILSVAQSTGYRLRIQSLAVQALDAAGQARPANQRRLAMVQEYAAAATNQLACPYYSGYAYTALVSLVGDNVPVDEFERGLVDYCDDQYDPALAAFTRSIQAGNRVAESRYWAGLAFRAQGDTDNALRQFNLVNQNFPDAFVWSLAWLEKGRTYVMARDWANAISLYREFAARYPSQPDAPEALWRAGLAAVMANDGSDPLDAWRKLSEAYPSSEWNTPALMWQGKLALAQGQTVTATTFFSMAAAASPGAFYGVRAAEWLRGDSTPLRPISATLTFDEAAQRAESEAWLAARLAITDTAQLRSLRRDLAADPALERGLELNRLGLQAEAWGEFDVLMSARQNDPAALYQLAILFRDLGAYRHSIAAADALIRRLGVRVADAPAFLGRLVYPAYYGDLVAPEARERGLDPLLVFALVRQESLFASLSYSSAAAHGLMQIIPATGEGIAAALDWPNYTRADLYKPYISIKFGVYYLARQRDGLQGDLYAALAAYNGGPGNAARWQAASRGDPDLFYETVSFSETRLYIRRISEYYETYKKLYGK